MSDILGLGVTAPAAASGTPEVGGGGGSSGGGIAAAAGKPQISREGLVALVQKLQKRVAASDAQVASLKQQLDAARSSSGGEQPTLVDLLTNVAAAVATEQPQLSPQQATTHAMQLANLQAELRTRSESIDALTRQLADSKKRCQAATEEVARLQRAAAAAPAASPSPSPSPSPDSSASSTSGGSFLLENANKALRQELTAEQAKVAAAEQRLAQLQREQADASKSSLSTLEAAQKRLADEQAKLTMRESKLVQSFQLMTEEKKRSAAIEEELQVTNAKLTTMAAALSTSQELLREQQGQLEQAQGEAASLRATNVKLASRVDQASSDDVADLKKTLASRDEHLLALQNELDHTRSIHARTVANLDNEFALSTRQLEDALEEERRLSERLTREAQEALARNEIERNTSRRLLADAEERAASLAQEHAAAVSSQAAMSSDLAAAQQQLSTLREEHQAAVAQASASLQEVQSSMGSKYTRLLHELKQYKIHTITNTTALQNEIATLQQANAALEDEIRHGKPAERRIYELATLQSSRDEALRESERECAEHRALSVSLRGKLEAAKAEAVFLQQEVRAARASSSRASINLDYLKSVLIQFIAAEHAPQKRQALVPVIAQLLCFTPEELTAAQPAEEPIAQTFWSALSFATGKAPPPKRITLPPNVPLGVELDLGHRSDALDTHASHALSHTQPLPAARPGHAPSSSLTNVDLTGAVPVSSSS